VSEPSDAGFFGTLLGRAKSFAEAAMETEEAAEANAIALPDCAESAEAEPPVTPA
jgi:hypothetical protein